MPSCHRHQPPPATELVRRRGTLGTVLGVTVSGLVAAGVTPGRHPFGARQNLVDAGRGHLERRGGTPEDIGHLLFTTYLLPFEITSILILIAIVGAVVLARKEMD